MLRYHEQTNSFLNLKKRDFNWSLFFREKINSLYGIPTFLKGDTTNVELVDFYAMYYSGKFDQRGHSYGDLDEHIYAEMDHEENLFQHWKCF